MTYDTDRAQEILAEGKKTLARASFKALESLISAALYIGEEEYSGEGQMVYKALQEHRGTFFSATRVANVLDCEREHAHEALHFLAAKFWLYSGECGEKVYCFRE